jgi:serine/threonine protein kinase
MRFGQYEILGRIAVGGMAEVYRGRAVGDEGFEKPVAIKRILPPFASDDRFVSMLVTEARIHASLSHRNIVQIHDLGLSEEGEHFIVLEYVDGRDLAALLDVLARTASPAGRSLRLSDAVALYVIIELGDGVHFAHELRGPQGPLGLVHRDISPSNVLISYAGEVKLSDFGLAKRNTDHSVVGSLKGKLAYMSPEQARGSTLDRRTDIFALGAVLFEMVTGRRLREIAGEVEGWREVASGLVPAVRAFRPDLPAAVERVLAGALAPDPRDRFPDARALVDAAREALSTVARAPTSEEVELQELLRTVLPPGAPRSPAPASKVIRLVSEFLPADQTVRAAAPKDTIEDLHDQLAEDAEHAETRETDIAPADHGQDADDGDDEDDDGETQPRAPVPAALLSRRPEGAAPAPESRGPRRDTADTFEPRWRSPSPQVSRSPLGSISLFVLALLPGIASLVHYFVIPLPVLASWSAPARLDVVSRPAGAAVLLDGRPLSAATPTYTEVVRDRRPHLVEVRKDGFQAARRPIRFDQAEILSVTVSLQPEPRPSFSPMPMLPPARLPPR